MPVPWELEEKSKGHFNDYLSKLDGGLLTVRCLFIQTSVLLFPVHMELFSLFYSPPTHHGHQIVLYHFSIYIWNVLYVFSLRLNDFWLKLLVLKNSLLLVSINLPVLFLFMDSRLPKKIWGYCYRAIDNTGTFINSGSVLSWDVDLEVRH